MRRDTSGGPGRARAAGRSPCSRPLVLLLPWSAHLLAHPTLLLLEPGLNGTGITDPDLRPWDVLLLHPGGPGMTPLWLTIGIVVGGLLALLRADRLRVIGAFAILGGLALAMGLLQAMVLVTPPGATDGDPPVARARRPCSSASP